MFMGRNNCRAILLSDSAWGKRKSNLCCSESCGALGILAQERFFCP